MDDHDAIERVLFVAKSKSDLHRAIDALPDDAKLILVADACCCGDPEHATKDSLYMGIRRAFPGSSRWATSVCGTSRGK